MRLRRLRLAPMLLPIVLLAGCQTLQATIGGSPPQAEPAPPPAAPPPAVAAPAAPEPAPLRLDDGYTRVALLAPLSGPDAEVGEALVNAAQMALFEIAGDDLMLLVEDTRGTPEGAQAAARAALDDGAQLILGPLFGTSVAAAAPEAAAAGVAVIAYSNDLTVVGQGVYLMGVPPQAQIDRVIDYAARQGYLRVGVFAPWNAYGTTVIAALRTAAERHGVEVTRVETYDPQAADVSAEVQRLADYEARRAALLSRRAELSEAGDEASKLALARLRDLDTLGPPPFEAVLVPAGGRELLTVAPLLPFYDIDPGEVRFLGTRLWDDPALGTEPALVGGWYAAPPRDFWPIFAERYQALYATPPPRLASLAYDSMALAAVLLREAAERGDEAVFTAEAIVRDSGFAGVDGLFRFHPDGRIERGLAVMELQRNKIETREPAPDSFAVPTG